MDRFWISRSVTQGGRSVWTPRDRIADARQYFAVYGLYSGNKRPLYVGSTDDLLRRLREHRSRKDWWVEVTRAWVDTYTDPDRAVAAEYKAIKRYRPVHNVSGNGPLREIDAFTVRLAQEGWRPAVEAVKWLFEQPPELRTEDLGSLTREDFPNIDWQQPA